MFAILQLVSAPLNRTTILFRGWSGDWGQVTCRKESCFGGRHFL